MSDETAAQIARIADYFTGLEQREREHTAKTEAYLEATRNRAPYKPPNDGIPVAAFFAGLCAGFILMGIAARKDKAPS